MKIWLPYVVGGSGVDVFTNLLARGLREHGAETVAQPIPHALQYAPMLLRRLRAPANTDIVITNSWNGFAFRRQKTKLVVIEHHCIFDPAYLPYRSRSQGIFHDGMVKRFERASFDAADLVIAVSHYTADATSKAFSGIEPKVIHNGIDTGFFSPASSPKSAQDPATPFNLLFVGNLTERKGADLLAPIMAKLGRGFQLHFTGGLRSKGQKTLASNMHATGYLSNEQLRQAYRDADALLFPTRLEGFGYAAVEAMACGTPVIASNASAIPEVVEHRKTGLLCPVNDVNAFVNAVQLLKEMDDFAASLGENACKNVQQRFRLTDMAKKYLMALETEPD